jgi:hypothetical protein
MNVDDMMKWRDNAGHKWRATKSNEKGTSVEINQDSSKPQDIARPFRIKLIPNGALER